MSGRVGVRLVVASCVALAVLTLLAPASAGLLAPPVHEGVGADATAPQATTAFAQSGQISVASVSVDRSTVAVGETVTVEARIRNDGEEATSYEATLQIDGQPQTSKTVGSVQPGFPVIVPFEYTFEEAGTYTVSVDGVDASQTVTVEQADGGENDGQDGSNGEDDGQDGSSDGGDGQGGSDGNANDGSDQPAFTVENVSFDPASPVVGETVTVSGEINNMGEERRDIEVAFAVDGETVERKVVPQVGPTVDVPATFEYTFEETGTYNVSIGGVAANESVTVSESGGGGGLFGFLGFLPMGILRPILLFLVLPIAVIYLALKALAIYLGY